MPNTSGISAAQRRKICTVLVFVLCVALAVAWITFYSPPRPMFHNLYGRNDHMVFSRWMWEPPATDRDGNYAIADYDLNLLLVVLIGDRDGISIYPYETVDQDKAVIRLHCRKPDTVVVSKDRNKLIVLFSNGTRLQADLAPRLAERIYKITRSKMADSLLTEISDACNSEPMRRFLNKVSSQAKEHGTTRPSSSISDRDGTGNLGDHS